MDNDKLLAKIDAMRAARLINGNGPRERPYDTLTELLDWVLGEIHAERQVYTTPSLSVWTGGSWSDERRGSGPLPEGSLDPRSTPRTDSKNRVTES